MKAAQTKTKPSPNGASAQPARRDGTKECVEALFQTHYESLCWFATSYLGDLERAEDVVQEVFLQICKQRLAESLRDPKAYLFRAVRNRALNECNRKGVVCRSDRDVEMLVGSAPSDEKATCAEVRKAVRDVSKQLSERQREVFVLGCIEEFTHAEIAEVLGLSTKTVSTHMARAKRVLREGLECHR
jgi:RNA polymerase sigma-70 factor (ECF subfamily)